MAGFADKEYLRDADLDPPVDGVASPPVAQESPPAVTPYDETSPTNHPRGSSTSPNFLDLGTTLHDATRVPVDDLWQNGFEGGGKGPGSVAHTNDLAAAQNGLMAGINAGQFSGAALGHAQAILSDIAAAISTANASVSSRGMSGGAPVAEQALSVSHLSILNTVNTDPALANPAPQGGAAEPAPAAAPAETTTDANPAETGDGENTAQTVEDSDAVEAAMQALMAENPDLFSGLTSDEVDAIRQQIEIELAHINEGDVSLVAAQGDGDNIVDITDIVVGDINLASMIAQGQSNSPEQQAINVVGSQDTQALPQVATMAISDVPVTIVTAEAPTIVIDHGHSGEPELANHLHQIWG